MRGASGAARRRCQGWPLGHREAARSVLDSVEHGVTLTWVGTVRPTLRSPRQRTRAKPVRSEGNLRSGRGAIPRLTTLYSVGLSEGHDHDAVMRIGGRFRAAAPIYKSGTTARVGIGAPPPRIVWAAHNRPTAVGRQALRSYKAPWLMGQGFMTAVAVQIAAGFNTTPAGRSPVVT